MTRISWDNVTDRFYDAGLDRGVLYPRTKNAVPWNGLTSVDETGAESAETYFIDGRPYLHMPKAKEFAASLKAITYPDELSELMGLVEAADGMYLDSQIGNVFDLSYRTLVGNPIEGTAHGYKIHLIYNAIATPDGITNQTLSDSFNPTQFSWQIQAVPIALPGYRPTAHIIIDTRHMDPFKVSQIEDLIYGTDGERTGLVDGGLPSDVSSDVVNGGDFSVIIEGTDGGGPGSVATETLDGGLYSSTSTGVLDGGSSLPPPGAIIIGVSNSIDGGGPPDNFTTVKALPDPKILYDILTFTGNVIITDLGNGFWTAEGPYNMVKITSPGYFQIDNVISVDTGNGTYTIASTNP